MRCSGFVSICFCLLLASCSAAYHFPNGTGDRQSVDEGFLWQPEFSKTLYRCEVNGRFIFRKFHLSGLLYMRNFSDTATRVVFQNELGITYFDFGWDRNNHFRVYHILEQMNKPALITTLKKDFEIFLGKNIDPKALIINAGKKQGKRVRHSFYKGFVYYYLSENKATACSRIDYGTAKKPLVQYYVSPPIHNEKAALPDSVSIRYLRAGFSIQLKKLPHDEQD